MKQIVLLGCALAMLAACEPYPNHPHGCPPGQAKKGNCGPAYGGYDNDDHHYGKKHHKHKKHH